MQGDPSCVLVEPGKCQFTSEMKAVELLERTPVSKTSSVLRFGLPDSKQPLNLSTCACILAHACIQGEDVTRPYTPISTNAQLGTFDVLIKDYPDGKLSHFICNDLQKGDTVSFSHIDKNVKLQVPFDANRIGMLVGGTGVTPMLQALHACLVGHHATTNAAKQQQTVTMLYGSKTSDDILGKELLDKWAAEHSNQFQVVYVLSDEPDDSDWKGERGYITKELVEKYFPSPSEDKAMVFICGPPPMYQALTGPRDEQNKVTGLLGEMGYTSEQVYKF
jgi:cytochrome-b5 reductase